MTWNWQRKEWPKLTFDKEKIEPFEREFLHKTGMLQGSLKHVRNEDQDTLKVSLISDEAFKTSEIEGETLNRESLHSSIGRHFGLKTDSGRVGPSEHGISEMMIDLYKNYATPLDHSQLFTWHEMLMNGRRDLLDIRSYRSHEEPMQIVSNILNKPKVFFEAPPSDRVKSEMDGFIAWYNRTSEKGKNYLQPLMRSGVAHIYFESIHPFKDGNGRIGRAISERALSQSLNRPILLALSTTIEKRRKDYYDALQRNSVNLDITDWLEYFCNLVLTTLAYTQSMIDFLIEKGKFYHRHEAILNERQKRVIDRIFKEGIEGFKGGLSAKNYMTISGATASTATRDLQKLVELGALRKDGELKSTRYYLNINHSALIAHSQ